MNEQQRILEVLSHFHSALLELSSICAEHVDHRDARIVYAAAHIDQSWKKLESLMQKENLLPAEKVDSE